MALVTPDRGWTGFSTGDAAVAEEWITKNLSRSRIDFSWVPEPRDMVFSAVTAPVGDVLVTRVRNAAGGDCHYDPDEVVFVCCSRGGRYEVRQRSRSYQVGLGDVFVAPCDRGFDFTFGDVDFDIVCLPRSLVDGAAADLLGYGCRVTFTDLPAVTATAKKHWLATMAYTYGTVGGNPEALQSPLVASNLARNLAATLLSTFANNTRDLSAPGRAGYLPAVVRRAVSYMESNAERDITLAEIAGASRVSPRALQAAFRSHLDTTPLGHLRRVRLSAAHSDLQSADPADGDTVAAIAARWGFPDPAHFATAYRRAYGRPPSTTLRG